MAMLDRLNLSDVVAMGLSESPDPLLPATLSCPQAHVAMLQIIHQDNLKIPCYACSQCTIVYRYSELMGYEKGVV